MNSNEKPVKPLNPKLIPIFRELGLIADDSKNTTQYSKQNIPGSRLDVGRFIRDQPYWANPSISKIPKQKKIIINFWQFLLRKHRVELTELWDYLKSHGFSIYFYDNLNDKFKKVDDYIDSPDYLNIVCYRTEVIKQKLIEKGEDLNQYYILDHVALKKLLVTSRTNLFNSVFFNEKQIVFDWRSIQCHIDEIEQSLLEQFETVKLIYKSEDHDYEFVWKNNFNQTELNKFFKHYIKFDELGEILKDEKSRKNLIQLRDIAKSKERAILDVSVFENLEKLELDNFFNVTGLKNLKQLKEVMLKNIGLKEKSENFDDWPIFDFTSLDAIKSLKTMTLGLDHVITMGRPSKFENLEKLTLSGIYPQLSFLDGKNTNRSQNNMTQLSLQNVDLEKFQSAPVFNNPNLLELMIDDSQFKILDLARFPKLRKLELRNCVFSDIKNMGNCKELEELHIRLFYNFIDKGGSTHYKWLMDIVNGNIQLPKLIKIHLFGFKELYYFSLKHLKALKLLDLAGMRNLISIEGIHDHPLIHYIGLVQLPNLKEIDIRGTSLNNLNLMGLPLFEEVRGLKDISSLLSLNIIKCPKLTINIPDYNIPFIKTDKIGFDLKRSDEKTVVEQDRKINDPLPIYINTKVSKPKSNQFLMDVNTYTAETATHNVQKIFVNLLNQDQDPHVAHYRKIIVNSISVNELNAINLETSLNPDYKPYAIPTNAKLDEKNVYKASLAGPFYPGCEYDLYGLSSQDELLSITEREFIDITYSPELGLYKIKVKSDAPKSLLSINYFIKTPADFFIDSVGDLKGVPIIPGKPLPDILKNKLKECLDLKNTYHTSIKPSEAFLKFAKTAKDAKSPDNLLNAIIEFCKKFTNEPLSMITQNGMNDLLTMIWETKGSCRHRNIVFLALCKYFGFSARININDCHAFPEVYLAGLAWKAIDLGGAPSRLNYQKNTLVNLNRDILDTKKEESRAKKESEKYHSDFFPNVQWLTACKDIKNVVDGLLLLDKSPLIRISDKQDAWRWHAAFHEHLTTPTIYIESVEELHAAFTINQIKDNQVNLIDGPLKQLIKTGNGNIVINWTNFSANEKAIFKSLIDDPPTLNGIPIPNTVKVIGILPELSEANDVFLSRCEEIRIPRSLALSKTMKNPSWLSNDIKEFKDEKIETVNLYHDNDWMQYLVESIKIDQDDLISKEGPLIQSMRNGLPLIIKNPLLQDDNFKLFWHKFTTEGYVWVNGVKVFPKSGFKVILQDVPFDNKLNFHLDDKLNEQKRKFYITDENFNQLFSIQRVTEQGKVISSAKGLLAECKEGDQFIINKELSSDQKEKIIDAIAELKKQNIQLPEIHFCIQSIPSISILFDSNDENFHIKTNDPLRLVDMNKLDLKSDNIFYTTPENNWANFFEELQLVKTPNGIRANRKEQLLWEKLKKGETVILCGDLSKEEYSAIKTLFMHPPYLYINGKREENIQGKLKWISKPQPYNTNEILNQEINLQISHYRSILIDEVKNADKDIITQLNHYLDKIRDLKNMHLGISEILQMSYEKYKSFYSYVESKSDQQNPIKPLMQYYFKKGTEEYAYLNVFSKYFLSKSKEDYVRHDKLKKLISADMTDDEFKKVFWRVLNCFSAKAIRELVPELEAVTFGQLNTNITNQIISDVRKIILNNEFKQINKVPGIKRFEKQQSRLAACLNDNSKKITFLLGPAGTGKTFTAKRAVKKENLFVGEDNIKNWLEAKTSQAVLLLDEANLEQPGKWEFLRGIFENPPVITYQNKKYPLGPQHKVIITGNPSDYPGRHWHSVFWDKAHVIWFAPFQPLFIKEKIQEFLPGQDAKEIDSIAKTIYQGYEYLIQHSNRMSEITLRDIENICARFQSTRYPISRVIFDEMEGILADEKERIQFKQFLETISGNRILDHKISSLPKNLFIPEDYHATWQMLLDDLKMRDERVKAGDNILPGRTGANKLGTLLEGPSGIGKSTLLISVLKHLNYDLNSADTQKKYYQITVGSLNVSDILLKAFHEGSIVILDELNLTHDIEKLLNQLLSGSDMSGRSAAKPGFMVLATQNPSTYAGTKASSTALISRFHKIAMKNISQKGVEQYAESEGHPQPKAIAQAYEEQQKKYPFVNARNMFFAVKKYKIRSPKTNIGNQILKKDL